MTNEGRSSSAETHAAIARAAAIFMPSVMVVAWASSAPRKIPGKHSTLLIWLGKSLRPVAMTATRSPTSDGRTSGVGLAIANTMASAAMPAMSETVTRPGPLTPTNTSAPRSASVTVPRRPSLFVFSANHCFAEFMPSRPAWRIPRRSTPTMSPTPAACMILAIAVPEAPTPRMATRRSAICLSTSRRAFCSAASTTTAVPCWSSWKTGMSSDSRNRCSTSKQCGAAMSSRLIPPNPGAIRCTASTIASTSPVGTSRQIG